MHINKNMKNLFEIIASEYSLSSLQKNQYLDYINFLLKENEKYNLTNIKTEIDVLYYHLIDTLTITKTSLLENKKIIADIGSGCGVPGILLAIFYPDKQFYLIEVINKKITFLNKAMKLLQLSNCVVSSYDFLTFIRQKKIMIDSFVARASLGLKEIIKIYQFDFYNNTNIIYWGSSKWQEDPKHNSIIKNKFIEINSFPYKIKNNKDERELNYITIKKIK
jgi:16S rRNA (guanine527-N7)-methyltransferase